MTTSPDQQRERELKFDVADDWQLPDDAVPVPKGGSVQRETVRLESTYHDTADRDLLRAGLTLRERRGDTDTGWHLKVPAGDARTEFRLPPGGRGVPASLRAMTHGARRGAALKPIAVLRVDRDVHRLLDADGTPLAELVVDDVHATEFGEFAVGRHWREVEVELGEGDEKLLARTARWLGKQGATPSTSGSKLRRALGLDETDEPDGGLAALLQAYLDEQYDAMLRGDLDLRRGEGDIHASRTASRRYRSVLRVFADVLDIERAHALEAELKWYAAGLGEVRDRQVLREHFRAALAGLPPELVLGPVGERIDETVDAEQQAAQDELERLMRSRRFFALVRELGDWHERVPVETGASADTAARYLDAATRKAHKRRKGAEKATDRDVQLHRARKAAKRARYVAEMCEPEFGTHATKARKWAKTQQRELGDHQDNVMAAEFLLRLGCSDAAAGIGFTLGVLHERQVAAG